jgi:adenylyltransferase/sulfurtransferase
MRYNNLMKLTDDNILRYSRNILIQEIGPEGQEKILGSSALVVGAGGLGSPALLYLVAAPERSVGRRKVESAGESIRAIRSDVVWDEHGAALTAENAVQLFRQYDVVIDGSDNFPTKYLCSDSSVLTGVPLVHAGVLRFGGQMTTIVPGAGPCLRCMIPEIPPRRDAPTCAESGILGAVAGIVGSWQAVEAIKILAGSGEPLMGRLLTVDTLAGTVSVHAVSRDPQCPACGEFPRIRVPLQASDYEQERSCVI